MLNIQDVTPDLLEAWRDRGASPDPSVHDAARDILAQVRGGGDAALLALTERLDGATLDELRLPDTQWDALADQVPGSLRAALKANMERIETFHRPQAPEPYEVETAPGVRAGRRAVPHAVAACYVPGGRASYPSTVLMTVPLARLAGAQRILVLTPPRKDGSIDPAVAYAARLAGATDIYRIGGAQAVGAVAYGTGSVPRAGVLVGPGNAYVTAAKSLVASEGRLWTDAPAGPSELLVIADEGADPDKVAWDLLAQAEHDPDAQVVLVTTSRDLAQGVVERLDTMVGHEPRADIIRPSLADNARIVVAADLEAAVEAADAYAGEHVEVHTRDAAEVAARLRHAGSIFIGPHAPVSLGDYGAGTDHVLPTMGQARIRGGLSVTDFVKWVTWQEVTTDGLAGIAEDVVAVAEAEGLSAHASAVTRRLA